MSDPRNNDAAVIVLAIIAVVILFNVIVIIAFSSLVDDAKNAPAPAVSAVPASALARKGS